MKRQALWGLLLASIAVLVAVVVPLGTKHDPPRRRVVIAVSTDPSSAPLFVAHAKGYFRAEGLDVSIVLFTTGKAALQAMYEKKADFATISDTVLMLAALDGTRIASIATIATSDRNHHVLALRDRGIAAPKDLAGKRIGVTGRTSGEYFLYTMLLFQGITYGEVTVVNLPPEQMERALMQGEVDAVASWHPTVGRLQRHFGDRAVVFEEHSYLMTWNLVGKGEYVEVNPITTEKILRALIRAKGFIMASRDDATRVTAAQSGIDPHLLREIWGEYAFDIRLTEVDLANIEGQARWAMRRYYPQLRDMPDFREYFYLEGLREIDPGAVSVVEPDR